MFRARGYDVIDLDFAHPQNSTVGYDPLEYIHNDEDVVHTAKNLIEGTAGERKGPNVDPYWNDCGVSVIAAMIELLRLNEKSGGIKPCLADVITLYRSMKTECKGGMMLTSLDPLFEKAEELYPNNQASMLWKTVYKLSEKTASCIFGVVNSAIDKMLSESIIDMTRKENRVNFRELGEKKIALFITTSPVNKSLMSFVNIMYADMFRELFEAAESNDDGRLSVPVHIICDDFACSGRIGNFDDYISIFRAAGISVTLLLQSETQLETMYGHGKATTIINNCDTYVYMGGMDIQTCSNISTKLNKPIHKIISMPLEQVVVFRRGSDPVVSRRYQTMDDPIYKENFGDR
jgi:type IV secretory pathway TraG/TraD family ATPase VirD4